ncbi:uncharacterized protein DUF4023 [Paenibacillus cellulosilyticus]|uniref:Uncharacterized protein DUF4023 n=1 Tax=Paenibacillus cellulosilyticus TaxID=375489 RepID=A0A2V2YSN6_9BACL|nr:DUF4023 domain-containing protein [Paenibacillus cellulosilyticus]PWV98619.1 uncharacterized protein DUF4023 [Paenibacillus cellulosilyticus]QKS43863.1 DUF4023 domain-containing protein [Paenibacillus cellulosilyticus]
MCNIHSGSTSDFVNSINEQQYRQRKNKERFGKGTPSSKLQTKQHTNNP